MSCESTTKPFFNSTVPIDWDIKTVGEAFEICNSLRLPISAEEREKMIGQYPYYGPTKIQGYLNEYRVKGTYALIGEDGDHFLKWKELPMTLLVRGEFNVNNHAHIIRGTENLTEWFFYYFNHKELTPHLTRQGAGRYKLTKDSLSKILIPLPPLAEQRAIADLLGTWDRAICVVQTTITAKEQRKKWLMQQLLTGKKRLKGYNESWKRVSAGEVFENVSVKGFDSEELLSATQDKGIIPRNMLEGRVTMPTGETTSFKLVEIGDFVISLRSFQGGLEYSYYRGIVSPAYTVLKPKVKIDDEYFKYYFKSYDFIGHLATAVIGIRDGKQVSYDEFCVVRIPNPSYEEQAAIASILQTTDKELNLLKLKLEAYKEQKKGLMQVLLTGKVRLKIN